MKTALLLLALALYGCDKAMPALPDRLMVSACQQVAALQEMRRAVFLECRV